MGQSVCLLPLILHTSEGCTTPQTKHSQPFMNANGGDALSKVIPHVSCELVACITDALKKVLCAFAQFVEIVGFRTYCLCKGTDHSCVNATLTLRCRKMRSFQATEANIVSTP